MEILGKLFGSDARVRMLRLFFLNPEIAFEKSEISERTKTNHATVRKELDILRKAGIVKKEKLTKETKIKRGKKVLVSRKKVECYMLDKTFPYGEQLKNLLVSTDLIKKSQIVKRFKKAGNVKLLVISGIFTKDDDSRLDIFIVGDKLKRGIIENTLKNLEAEAGKEIRYAVLDTLEFKYRLEVYDKFVRDVLDYPHETIIDRLNLPVVVPEKQPF